MPAKSDTPRYRQSPTAPGGTAPIRRSRVMPPEFPAAKDKTMTPNKSSPRLVPANAPLSAKTKVPTRSSTIGNLSMTRLSFASKEDEHASIGQDAGSHPYA